MKRLLLGLPLVIVPFFACATSNSNPGFDPGDGGPGIGDDGSPTLTMDGSPIGPGFEGGADSPFSGCAAANYQAKLTPAALLVVLDASGTMSDANKYSFAQQAIVAGIDQSAFDGAALGLLLYPTGDVAGPQCLAGGLFPVTCKVSGLAQVPLANSGTDKSNAQVGVRHSMYQQLVMSTPSHSSGDGNPSFDALTTGINALKGYSITGKRILLYITDGGASCTSLSTRPGYQDGNGCADWEEPDSIVTLLKGAHDDATAPINSFIVGVPGADTPGTDPNTPPYHVRNALSAYAFAGSPETVDPTCTGKAYTQAGADPTVNCHFDMTTNYTAQKLSDAINAIRGKLLGCVFELPVPDGGQIDKGKVNVVYSTGMGDNNPYKRKDSSNACTTDGCWDYNADGKVELFGKACEDVKAAPNANVQIVVGCETVVK